MEEANCQAERECAFLPEPVPVQLPQEAVSIWFTTEAQSGML